MSEFMPEPHRATFVQVACLMIHGLERGPEDYADLKERLIARGAIAEAMRLPGHGVSAAAGRKLGWPAWTTAVREQVNLLAAQRKHVILIGHSLGGVLALDAAAQDQRVAGIVSICTPIHISATVRRTVNFVRHLWPYYWKATEDNGDPEMRQLYRPHWVAWSHLWSLMQSLPAVAAELPQVQCPALLIAAREDRVVPWADVKVIADQISSPTKRIILLEQSHHAVFCDKDREVAIAAILDFIATITQ